MTPRIPRRATSTALAIALATMIALAPLATAYAEGFYYEASTVDRRENGKELSRMDVRAWIDGPAAKVEFAGTKGTIFESGSYLLTKDAGRTLHLVSPKEKAYSRWDVEGMLASAFALMESAGPMLDLNFSNAASQKMGEDDGGSLLGYPTRRYQWQTAYDMRLSVIGIKRQYRVESQQEFWVTKSLDAEGFRVWLRPDRVRTGNEEFDELLAAEMTKVEGFPLKTIIKTKMTTGKGKTQNSISTTEVTTLRPESSIPAATFELDPSYTEKPFLPGMPRQE